MKYEKYIVVQWSAVLKYDQQWGHKWPDSGKDNK